MTDTADRIVEVTEYDDPDRIRDLLAEHDYQTERAIASAMGLDPDDENLEETLAEAFAGYRNLATPATRGGRGATAGGQRHVRAPSGGTATEGAGRMTTVDAGSRLLRELGAP